MDHVLATFTRRHHATVVAERAKEAFRDRDVRLGDVDDDLDALVLAQRAELDQSIPMIAGGIFTGGQARGALVWGVIGLVVGAVIAAPLALLIDTTIPVWLLMLAFALTGALGLSSATFVLGAAARAIKEGETTPLDPTAVVRVDIGEDDAQEIRRFLVEAGARRAWFVKGEVLRPPTADLETPRPLVTDPSTTSGAGSDSDAGFPSDVDPGGPAMTTDHG
jgi:hypothetical protein